MRIPIKQITWDGNTHKVKGEIELNIENSIDNASANELGSETHLDGYLTGKSCNVTLRLFEFNFDTASMIYPDAVDINSDESELGIGSSACVNFYNLAKTLVVVPKCSGVITGVTLYKAVCEEGGSVMMSEEDGELEIPMKCYPDQTQTVPGTYDKEGELFGKISFD